METIQTLIFGTAIITAISTLLLAILTWRYVHLTNKLVTGTNDLVKETKRMVDEMTRPDVVALFKNERDPNTKYFNVTFCVKNEGTHTVRKVKFDVDPSFKANSTVIADIPWVKNGINVLPPGEMVSHSFYKSSKAPEPEELYENSKSKTEIKVEYEDIFKKEHSDEFPLDLHDIKNN